MNLLKGANHLKNLIFDQFFHASGRGGLTISSVSLDSKALGRKVRVDLFYPQHLSAANNVHHYPVLLLNDGQDMQAIALAETLSALWHEKRLPELFIAAIHAGDRIQEYGTANQLDYKGRGSKAGLYTQFVLETLRPWLLKHYPLSQDKEKWFIAGFSLGGLSALDIAWNQPDYFSKVGVFSGSLWWRSQAFTESNPDGHRIAHEMIGKGPIRPDMKFWFQAGTLDETDDRNNNGVIDAIDDTLHLMDALAALGYHRDRDMVYVQVEGGRHDTHTWGQVMPDFLQWLFA
ncbi:MAG TPA: alpha/beta hydrolase-fold protein [Saprospiraceae bacterium]|nr:alpha/beta hydrolase-fold protein [Saprospiraceae bacterium]HMQ83300.1 alpha/beta hydrolase-fold protein [Saprospiraceae bacterium]